MERVVSVDHVEFWCGNAKVLSKYYCDSFGFSQIALKGIETGNKRSSKVVGQNDLKFVFTSSLHSNLDSLSQIEQDEELLFRSQFTKHGEFVKDIAFRVTNVPRLFERAVANGAIAIKSPQILNDEHGTIHTATIGTPFSDVVHTLIDRSDYSGSFLPGFKDVSKPKSVPSNQGDYGISHIDHVALVYKPGILPEVMNFYHECLGFEQFLCSEEDSSEGMSVVGQEGGLKTLVAACSAEDQYSFKFVFVEPLPDNNAAKKRKNQVVEFLEYNGGNGVQHMAVHTHDIVKTVNSLQKHEVELINVPSAYYDTLFQNEGELLQKHGQVRGDLEGAGVLVDVNKDGHLLMQTFTSPLLDRPTFFLEVISRKGNEGFAQRTIKALFEAVERLQDQRTN